MKQNTKRTPFSYIKIMVLCFATTLSSQSFEIEHRFLSTYFKTLDRALNDVNEGEGQIQLLNNSILYKVKHKNRYGVYEEYLTDMSYEFKIIDIRQKSLILVLENEHFLSVPFTSIQGIMYSLEREGDKYVHEWKVQLKQLIFDGGNMPK